MASRQRNSTSIRVPWLMRLEDQLVPGDQFATAHQSTRGVEEMQYDVSIDPKAARLTGIMVTLGGTNSHPIGITEIVLAGADMVRINMSHEDEKWHAITMRSVREAGNRIYCHKRDIFPLGVAMDLRGPEIRTGIFNGDRNSKGRAEFKEGNIVRVVCDASNKRACCSELIWVSHANLPRICRVADKMYVDRGRVILEVICVGEYSIDCKVLKGGIAANENIVHLVDGVSELPKISEQDYKDVRLALDFECDFLIVSHVRDGATISSVKERIKEIGPRQICVLAKISSAQGLEAFDDILKVADGIVIDRAGLETDIGPEKIFLAQKCLISKCNKIGKPVVVTFRVNNVELTQVEMADVSRAVLDGTDSLFLTTGNLGVDETIKVVKSVDVACREAENARWQTQRFEELSCKVTTPLDPARAVALAAVEISMKCNAAAIIATTTSGRSAVMLSTSRPRCPVVAVTRYGSVARWLSVYFGINPIHYRISPCSDWSRDMDSRIQYAMDHLRRDNIVKVGDAVIIVSGWRRGAGFTNCIRIIYASPGLIPNVTDDYEDSW